MTDRTSAVGERDLFLDCLKGVAILLVVLGHHFQNSRGDFDNYTPFRIVYSFHMPMFMFVSGMVAALSFRKYLMGAAPSLHEAGLSLIDDLLIKAIRLLLPFLAWGIFQFYYSAYNPSHPATVWQWLVILAGTPDFGLWFLPALFLIHVFLSVAVVVVIVARRVIRIEREGGRTRSVARFGLVLASGVLAAYAMHIFPGTNALSMARYQFTYFFAGLVFQLFGPGKMPLALRLLPYPIFMALAPFWYRQVPGPLVDQLSTWLPAVDVETIFRYTVAFAGTFVTIDTARLCARYLRGWPLQSLAFLGERSLDIYALHGYFSWPVPVLGAVLQSLVISSFFRLNDITALIFFGQGKFVTRLRRHFEVSSVVVFSQGALWDSRRS